MKELRALRKYFWKYRWRFSLGILFILISNYFGILAPQVTGTVIDRVETALNAQPETKVIKRGTYDPSVEWLNQRISDWDLGFGELVAFFGLLLLALALLRGFFMFLMRQTIIVMSRHIEFDQKNEIFRHYQQLDAHFYKTHSTGDLMSRMAEDVSRVRMYTGPAIMYLTNLIVLITFSVFYMFKKDWELTLYTLAPLPILAITIYFVNTIINRKSEQIQSQLSDLTTISQESYSGIRVIKSFVQEKTMDRFFTAKSDDYRTSAVNLVKVEAIYFPSIALLIGLSTLLTILIGGFYYMQGRVTLGTIGEFVVYVNMLTFPVSAIGWVASMIQRAAASQKRLNEFLRVEPAIVNPASPKAISVRGHVEFRNVSFTYRNTGIQALKNFDLDIKPGQKVAIIGRTGSGKSTIAQLLLRNYDPTQGEVRIDGIPVKDMELQSLRDQIGYVPQDVFLFSDTVANNIRFGRPEASQEAITVAATRASIHREIEQFSQGYETLVGERGVTLSGGQKQRISIARALIKDPQLVILDDCLSAVDARTEKEIIGELYTFLEGKTAVIITHRIFTLFAFDKIVVLDDGQLAETGTHEELLASGGIYAELYQRQQEQEESGS